MTRLAKRFPSSAGLADDSDLLDNSASEAGRIDWTELFFSLARGLGMCESTNLSYFTLISLLKIRDNY